MVNHIMMIGEACRAIPDNFQASYANIPWADIIAMRNILIYHYFGVDLEAVWVVVSMEIPKLKIDIQSILNDIDSSN